MISLPRLVQRTQLLNSGRIRVVHGLHGDTFAVAGYTVEVIRRSLEVVFNIGPDNKSLVNGIEVGRGHHLDDGDVLEFVRSWGRKSGLPINRYGDIDVSKGVPEGMCHINELRLGPICKRLGVEYAKAIVDWTDYGPVLHGIVVHKLDEKAVLTAIQARVAKQRKQADQLSIMAAMFTLNRRAKRCRDLARTYYQNRMHGLAGYMRREKERIYDLKSQVLHHLLERHVLTGGRFHQFEGGTWAEVLTGQGYTFHRPCPPPIDATVEAPDGTYPRPPAEQSDKAVVLESIEAKPKGAKEPPISVAVAAVNKFLAGKRRVRVYQWPARPKPPRFQSWEDWDEDDDLFGNEERIAT